MAETKTEEQEPHTNPEEETPTEPEVAPKPKPQEEKETPAEQKTDEPSEKEKRLYARLKKAEEKLAAKDKEVVEARKQADPTDIDRILAVQAATKGLGAEEVSELKYRATATGKSLLEARDDGNFKIWRKAYKIKVEEEKAPSPSTTQDAAEAEKKQKSIHSFEREDGISKDAKSALDLMSDAEKDEWLDGLTLSGVKLENLPGIDSKAIEAFKKEREAKAVEPIVVIK